MMVVLANKLKDYIDSSDLQALDYKSIVGYYPLSMFANYVKGQEIEMLLIDLSAVKDLRNEQSWKLVTKIVPTECIYILQDISNLDSVTTTTLVNCGIYNIGQSIDDIIGFMEEPNTYASIIKKIKQGPVSYEFDESNKKTRPSETWAQYQQNMMKEYLRKQRSGEFDSPKKKSVLKDQLINGFVILPLLTFFSTGVFYMLERFVYSSIAVDSDLGNRIYTKIPNLDFNLLVLVGLLIAAIIFSMYYSIINTKIKRNQYTRGKFMIVTMAIYCLIFMCDYHIVELFEGFFKEIPVISTVGYLYTDFYTFNYLVCVVALFTYYFELIKANSKVYRYEKDLSQRFNFFEKAYSINLFCTVITPFAYYITRAIAFESNIYRFFEELYISSNFMVVMTIIGIVITMFNIIGYILNLDLNAKVKEVNDENIK